MKKIWKTNSGKRRLPIYKHAISPPGGLINRIPLGLHQYQLQPNGDLLFRAGNPAADRILGIDHQALVGQPIEVAFPNLALTSIPDSYRQIAKNGGDFERELVTYQDEQVAGVFKVQAFQTGPNCMAALFQDIGDNHLTKRALAESEERYRSLVELSPEAIIVHSAGLLVYANPAAARLMGVDRPEQLLGLPVMDLLPPESRPLNLEMLAQVAQGKTLPPLEQTILRPGNSDIEVEMMCAPVLFHGKPAFQLIVHDITERKQSEKALRESEERYRRLFERADLGIFQFSPEGKALAVNPAFARMFGYSSPEDALATITDVAADIFDDPDQRAEITRMVQSNLEQDTFVNIYRRKDSSTFPGILHLHAVREPEPAGRLLYFEGLIEDVTERTRAEEQIYELAKFPDENPNPVARISREGILLYANQAVTLTFGYRVGQALPPSWQDSLGQVLENRQTMELEIQHAGRTYLFQLIPILNETYINLYGLDITQRKAAEVALQESERQLRSLIDAAPLGLHQYLLFPDGQLILSGANPAADRILEIDHQKLRGLPIEDAFPLHRQTEIPALYRQVAQAGVPFSSEQITHQDEQIQEVFEIHAFQTSPSRMAVFFQNVTEKKKAEDALRESEEKFRMLIEQNIDGVSLFDERGLAIEWNAAQEIISGIPRGAALGRTAWDIQFQVLLPEQKSPARYEMMKERGLRLLQNSQSPIFYQPLEASMRRPDGSETLIQQTIFPIQTNAGLRIGSILHDISDRKQAELALQRRMAELEALHAVALAGTEALSSADLLNRVNLIIREKLFSDHFGVAFLDAETRTLNYHPNFSQVSWVAHGQVSLDHGISGSVARTGIARRVADVRLDPEYLEANPDTRSELCVPIIIGGRVVGVINLENAKPGSFSEADERLVSALAGELGTALEKIRLLEEERNRRKELEALEQISVVLRNEGEKDRVFQAVLDTVMAVMHLQGAGIVIYDLQTGEVARVEGRGEWAFANDLDRQQGLGLISQQVTASQHYYLNNDVNLVPRAPRPDAGLWIKALLCLPLIVDGQTQGLLYLGRHPAFQPQDVHLAITIADTFASAFHRIELHEQTIRHLERLTALRAIDQSILSRLDLDQTLEVLLYQITAQLKVDAANFLLYEPSSQTLITTAERGLPAEPIWEVSLVLKNTHAGRVALSHKMEIIPDLGTIQDHLTERIKQIGENFTSFAAVPLIAKGELIGVIQIFSHTPIVPSADWTGFLEALADQAAIAIHSAQLFNEQQQTNARLTRAYEDTIDGWSHALDLRDKETEGHSQRVTEFTLELARRMGIADEQLIHIRRGARLHDIGKMGIPDSILLKPGSLTPEEWEIMRKHPSYAADLLAPIQFLGPALEIPYGHHEKWDGSGYPQGLKGAEIPLAARIFAVIDVWDALTQDRPYRPAWARSEAMNYIREQADRHFDPRVVEEFVALALDGSSHGRISG